MPVDNTIASERGDDIYQCIAFEVDEPVVNQCISLHLRDDPCSHDDIVLELVSLRSIAENEGFDLPGIERVTEMSFNRHSFVDLQLSITQKSSAFTTQDVFASTIQRIIARYNDRGGPCVVSIAPV